MKLSEIIGEADLLVPNIVEDADKVLELNQINQDFFNTVKIPKTAQFVGASGQAYVLPTDIREKNIDLVECGLLKYKNLNRDTVNPTENVFTFDDDTHTLTLMPAPYKAGISGIVRYHRIATTTFSATGSPGLDATPDAPEEYHWTYVLKLASFLANTQEDAVNAANFENRCLAAWNVAAQNYQRS